MFMTRHVTRMAARAAARPARGLSSRAAATAPAGAITTGRTVLIAGGMAAALKFREEIAAGLRLHTAQCEGADTLHYVVGGVVLVGAAAYTMARPIPMAGGAQAVTAKRDDTLDVLGVAVTNSVVELTRLYNDIDVDGDGDITLAEFSVFLEDTMGAPCDPAKLAAIDADADGRVSYAEFIQMWADHSHSLFNAAGGGNNDDGQVPYAGLEKLIPPNVPAATARSLMVEYDGNKDGMLSFPEFFLFINAAAKIQQIEGNKKRAMTPRAKRQAAFKAKRAAALAQAVQAETALNADSDDQ